jgi:hypothetical protein
MNLDAPISPPTGPATGSSNGLLLKSEFLAISMKAGGTFWRESDLQISRLMKVSDWLLCSILSLFFVGVATIKVNAANDFSNTGSMVTARFLHRAILLANGKALVAGGYGNSNSALSSAELFDPTTGLWTNTGSMGTARQRCRATALVNGKVLVSGGGDGGSGLSSAELFDPSTGLWTNTGSMNSAHTSHTATLLANGKVLVAGGYIGSTVYSSAELFDPTTGLWTNTGSMGSAREDHTAILLPNNKVLVAGGRSGSTYSSAELFDPATGLWTNTGSMGTARYTHTATLLANGKVLVAGGGNGGSLSSAELFDPATGLWTNTGSMGSARSSHTATLLANGKVLVAGGGNGGSLSSAELFDPATGLWTNTGSMGTARDYPTAILLANGKVLVAGGRSGGTTYVSSAELFDPVLPTITTQPANVITNRGAIATFSVTATNALSYQWQKAGVNIAGATNATLVLSNVQTSNVGSYTVVVSNIYGSLTSGEATLVVIVPPTITSQPVNVLANQGENAAFNVAYTGSISAYQWQKNGLDITGATNSTLSLNNVQPENSGIYVVVISNQAGSVMSNPATVTLTQGALYTQAQYDAAIQSGLQAGIQAGRTQVTDSPNYYGLYRLNQVQALNVETPLLTKDQLSGKFKLTIGVKKSTDLTTFTAFPFTSGEATINAQGAMEFQFTSPDNAAFFRLETH